MRHATTRWNELGITQGHTHNRLSKTSIDLTNKLSDNFKNTQIDLIITSIIFLDTIDPPKFKYLSF